MLILLPCGLIFKKTSVDRSGSQSAELCGARWRVAYTLHREKCLSLGTGLLKTQHPSEGGTSEVSREE